MNNLLPSLTVLLVGTIILLLSALGLVAGLHLRRSRLHQNDLQAVMDIARHVGQSPAARPGHAPRLPPEPIHEEFVERTNRTIGEIHEAIARLDVKLGQTHREDVMRDEELDRRIGKEDHRILALQQELQDLRTRHTDLEQQLQQLRVGIEDRARREASAEVKTAGTESPSPAETSISTTAAAPAGGTTSMDDFALPESVLNELKEVVQSATRQPRPAPAMKPQVARMPTDMPRPAASAHKTAAPPTPAHPATARSAVAVAHAVAHKEKVSVEEPQFAFDPARIDDLFNAPSFIPGAANAGINVEELDLEDLNPDPPDAGAENPEEPPHYDAERVFYQASPQTGIKAGWYFTVRGGKTHGPFGTKEAGERVLQEMIEQFKRTGDSGGR